jgi:manganese/zinc/iron transport system permease protein
MNPTLWLYLIAALSGLTCSLAGTYLVIRKSAMIADAISHSILPGLVAAFFLARGPNLLAGLLGALASGLLTVWVVETLTKRYRLKQDAAIGLVFPFLFAIGVLWISADFSNVHLDTDSVLFGEITLAPFDLLKINNQSYGPQSIWLLAISLLTTTIFLNLFKKELQLATFDSLLAAVSGFNPSALHYGLMSIVAIATVASFAAVGAILSVALIITPPAIARLLANQINRVIPLAAAIGTATALSGTAIAVTFDLTVSGTIATLLGILYLATVILAPKRGILAQTQIRRRDQLNLAIQALLIHLSRHAGTQAESTENTVAHLTQELGWSPTWTQTVISTALHRQAITQKADLLKVGPNAEKFWQR